MHLSPHSATVATIIGSCDAICGGILAAWVSQSIGRRLTMSALEGLTPPAATLTKPYVSSVIPVLTLPQEDIRSHWASKLTPNKQVFHYLLSITSPLRSRLYPPPQWLCINDTQGSG